MKFLSFILLALLNFSVYAATLYRHPPFTVVMNSTDALIVDYDISEKNGIRCMSDHKKLFAEFVYKGREKKAMLPITLQSAHVPKNINEELADVSGQFRVLSTLNHDEAIEITCDYLA